MVVVVLCGGYSDRTTQAQVSQVVAYNAVTGGAAPCVHCVCL